MRKKDTLKKILIVTGIPVVYAFVMRFVFT